MQSLRRRLILVYLLATVPPLAATVWISASLLDRSLGYASTEQLDRVSQTLENTARLFYQRERDALGSDATSGRIEARHYVLPEAGWPAPVRQFWTSGEDERYELSGDRGDHLDLLRRDDRGVALYRRSLSGARMEDVTAELRRARELTAAVDARDLRRGFTLTLFLLIAIVWAVSLVPLVLIARRVSRPIQRLTAGLAAAGAGDWEQRLEGEGPDEVGRAVAAFNRMVEQLRASRDRLVYLTQMSSWQTLARKTAHELKNSLTPIRLTVEEMLARQPGGDRAFLDQAAQIVVGEIETLERRVRAFSELASDPPVATEPVDLPALVLDRIALLQPAHAGVSFTCERGSQDVVARASVDLVKSVLTNLLDNAADAAGPSGTVLARCSVAFGRAVVEIHDSGPGLSEQAAATLFEPTVTFKKHGMGLGLSIARKHALLQGGDIRLVPGALSGAAFRVELPLWNAHDAVDAGTTTPGRRRTGGGETTPEVSA